MLNNAIKALKVARGRIRLFFGFCPACNSDAPEMYDCHVCEWPTQPFAGINQSTTIKETWWHNFKRQLSGPLAATVIQPDPNAESCTAASWPLPGTLMVDNTPPGPILSQHYGASTQDDAIAVEILNGSRPGVQYDECPECVHNTFYHTSTSPGYRESREHYECENPDCGHTETYP